MTTTAATINYSIDTTRYKGIIAIYFRDNYDFMLADCKMYMEELKLVCGSTLYPILKIPGKFSTIDEEVREFISSKEGLQCSAAEAIVTFSLPQRIIGNFYLKVNKPSKPTALFDTEEQAVAWLEQFIK